MRLRRAGAQAEAERGRQEAEVAGLAETVRGLQASLGALGGGGEVGVGGNGGGGAGIIPAPRAARTGAAELAEALHATRLSVAAMQVVQPARWSFVASEKVG